MKLLPSKNHMEARNCEGPGISVSNVLPCGTGGSRIRVFLYSDSFTRASLSLVLGDYELLLTIIEVLRKKTLGIEEAL